MSPVPALPSILTHKLCLHRNDIVRAKIVPRPKVCMTTKQKMVFTDVVKHFLPNESGNLFFGKKLNLHLFGRMRNGMMCQAFKETHALGLYVSQETQLLKRPQCG